LFKVVQLNEVVQLPTNIVLSISGTVFHRVTPKDLEGTSVNLHYVKFQNVQNIQLFFKDNQNNTDTMQINHLVIIGSAISTTNMGDFKHDDIEHSSYFCLYYSFQD
jgi:hypothetical protein